MFDELKALKSASDEAAKLASEAQQKLKSSQEELAEILGMKPKKTDCKFSSYNSEKVMAEIGALSPIIIMGIGAVLFGVFCFFFHCICK